MRPLPWRLGLKLFGEADGFSEKLGLAKFAAQNLLLGAIRTRRESVLVLHGLRYKVLVRAGELGAYHEIHVKRAYERVDGFAPRAGNIVLDVGANIGTFSIRHAAAGARVFAFEPNPDCFARLRENVELNGLASRIYPFPFALGRARGHATLDRSTTTVTTRVVYGEGSEIAVRTLDEVAGEIHEPSIDLIKLDIEGAEAAVLAGGPQTLRRTKRIVFEYHSPDLLEATRGILLSAGFDEIHLDDEGYAYYLRRTTSRGTADKREAPGRP